MKNQYSGWNCLLKSTFLCLITLTVTPSAKPIAEWSILTYIQADNSLAEFANFNITSMQKGMQQTSDVNMLVQWDQPNNNKTWRYKIVPGGRVEDGSLSSEMGQNPGPEIVTAMQWVQTK